MTAAHSTPAPAPARPWFATCPRGVEPWLAEEARELGLPEPEERAGGVAFAGDWSAATRACLWLRCAVRVLRIVGEGPADSADALYRSAARVDWARWISPQQRFRVDATLQRSALRHSGFAALKVKDALVDRVRAATGRRPDVDRDRPDVRVRARVHEREVIFSLDLAGRPLHERGWRSRGGEAPMKESLAAALLRASGWRGDQPLYDPFCGGGTIGIEAAWIAERRAPGLAGGFAFERWPQHDARAWARQLDEARALNEEARAAARPPILLSDLDRHAVGRAREHARAAGVALEVRRADALEFTPSAGPGLIACNPPYGERMGEDLDALDQLYRGFGDRLKRVGEGCELAWFTALDRARALGLKPRRRVPFFNGPIECRLLLVPLFSGSGRTRSRGA
ncbi:MAG: methyltransferase [Myxococcales bacterium]|nr:methyltransferase [Myxococcales bacterium]